MTIPATVLQVLNDWQINFQTATASASQALTRNYPEDSSASYSARSILLFDEIGIIQLMIPSNRILDLHKVEVATGRKLSALPMDKQDKLKRSLGVENFPALPQVTRLDSLVDDNLFKVGKIYVESGNTDEWISLSSEEFKNLTTSANIGDYSSQLPANPLQQSQDKKAINNSVTQFTQLRIKQRLEETLDLPPLPEVARKIIELKMDPDADTGSLAKIISVDPSIAAQVVAWARSPYYGAKGNVNTVEEAVIRVLGFNLVINLALGLSLGRNLAIPKDGPNGYASNWEQAVTMAALMAELIRLMPVEIRPNQGEAYLTGLLHNFGFLILGHVFPPQFSLINRHIETNAHIGRHYIEQHLLGLTREQISSDLLDSWHLPSDVVNGIRFQNKPEMDKDNVMANLLHVASRLLRQQGFGDGPLEKPQAEILDFLELDLDECFAVVDTVLEQQSELQQMAKLMSS